VEDLPSMKARAPAFDMPELSAIKLPAFEVAELAWSAGVEEAFGFREG